MPDTFVALMKDGTYVHIGEVSSHASHTVYNIGSVTHLNDASVHSKREWTRRLKYLKEPDQEVQIALYAKAKLNRTVILEGVGDGPAST